MKMRMFAVLLIAVLLLGSICGCDDMMDTANDSVRTTTTIDDTETPTIIVTTTTRRTTTTTKRLTTTTTRYITEAPAETMVWIPASGSKYHRKSSCSNMKNPSQVTKSRAIELGYSP